MGSTSSPAAAAAQAQFTSSLLFNDRHRDLIHHIAFDFHGRRMATSSSDMMVCVWNANSDGSWTRVSSWKSHGGPVWKVIWAHPEFGQILATCSFDRSVMIWEETARPADDIITRTGLHGIHKKETTHWKRVCNLVDSRHNVTDIKFAPRYLGLMIATASSQGVVRIYEAPDIMNLSMWNLKDEITVFKYRCSSLTWSSNRLAKTLIAISSDELKINGKRVAIYEYHENLRKWQLLNSQCLDGLPPVSDLAFAPSAGRTYHLLAIGSTRINIYKISEKAISQASQIDNGKPSEYDIHLMESLDTQSPSYVQVWRLSWNITGTILTAGSSDGNIRIWKATFMKKWVLVSTIKTTEESKDNADDPRMATSVASLTKQSQVYY